MSLKNNRYVRMIKLEIINIGPVKIGNGDEGILIDRVSNSPYLPGTSVAGAIKAYIEKYDKDYVNILFGSGEVDSDILISDSYALDKKELEFRPGVAIDNRYGTNIKGAYFERELLGEGHRFSIDIKIHSKDVEQGEKYLKLIKIALSGIQSGELRFGGNKTNGAGIFNVEKLIECNLDLKDSADLYAYISDEISYEDKKYDYLKELNISTVMFTIEGETDTPLLVKGNGSLNYKLPDGSNITNSNGQYIIPGSSFKASLRNAFNKISRFKGIPEFTEIVFGDCREKNVENEVDKKSGRLFVEDIKIENSLNKSIYNRIRIDKFTGGVRNGVILDDNPIKGSFKSNIFFKPTGNVEEDNKSIAIILYTLKDALTGNISFGSGYSIGRGKLKGSFINVNIKGERFKLDLIGSNHENKEKIQELISSIN